MFFLFSGVRCFCLCCFCFCSRCLFEFVFCSGGAWGVLLVLSAGVKRVSACSSRKAPQLHLVISLLSVQSVLSLPRSFWCVAHACLCCACTRLRALRLRPPSLVLVLACSPYLILSYLYLSLSVSYLCYPYLQACKSCSASSYFNCLLLPPLTCTFCPPTWPMLTPLPQLLVATCVVNASMTKVET